MAGKRSWLCLSAHKRTRGAPLPLAPHPNKLNPKHLIGWPEKMKLTSRRSALFSAAIIPAVALCNSARAVGADVVLVALGQRFDALAAQIDHSIDHGSDIAWQALDEAVLIHAEIVATPATTMEGLYVKARAGCWALFGDLDADEHSSADHRTGLSIMRDLIRLYQPNLERPGALKRLIEQTTENGDAHSPGKLT